MGLISVLQCAIYNTNKFRASLWEIIASLSEGENIVTFIYWNGKCDSTLGRNIIQMLSKVLSAHLYILNLQC